MARYFKTYKEKKSILIKEVDKVEAVVIMNDKLYLKILSDRLNDKTTQKMAESNCDAKVTKQIAKIPKKCKASFF